MESMARCKTVISSALAMEILQSCTKPSKYISDGDLVTDWSVHYDDVIMSLMVSQITSLTIVYSTVYSGADQRKHQSSVSLAFVRGIHRVPVNSPHKRPVTRNMFPFDDVIMWNIRFSLLLGPIHIDTRSAVGAKSLSFRLRDFSLSPRTSCILPTLSRRYTHRHCNRCCGCIWWLFGVGC